MRILAVKTIVRDSGLASSSTYLQWSCPLRLLYGKEEAFWTLASTLAIAIVKSSARIRLELLSDHSALVAKTREDHDVRDLAFRTLDPTKITRKTVLALWPLSPRGYSPQMPHVRSGAASRLAARTRRKFWWGTQVSQSTFHYFFIFVVLYFYLYLKRH